MIAVEYQGHGEHQLVSYANTPSGDIGKRTIIGTLTQSGGMVDARPDQKYDWDALLFPGQVMTFRTHLEALIWLAGRLALRIDEIAHCFKTPQVFAHAA